MSFAARLLTRIDDVRRHRTGEVVPIAPSAPARSAGSEREALLLAEHLPAVIAHNERHPIHDLVLITLRGDVHLANAYARELPTVRIHLVHLVRLRRPKRESARASTGVTVEHRADTEAIANYLANVAPPQMIVDLAGDRARQFNRLASLIYFLDSPARHSAYLVKEPADIRRKYRLARVLARLKKHSGALDARYTRLVEAVADVKQDRDLVTITPQGRYAVKLHDTHASAVLQLRSKGSWGQQIGSRPAVQFKPRTTLWTNVAATRFRPVLKVPELFLREYRDVVCGPRALALTSGVMLPVSFNRLCKPTLESHSPYAPNITPWSVQLDPVLDNAPALEGVYFHLDSPYPWGFGHFMGEDMSKLWAWEEAKARHPDLRVLLSSAAEDGDRQPTGRPKPHQLALLAGFGIGAEDVVCLTGPARVELLLGATPMFDNPHYVHPEITKIWDARRESVRTPAAERPATPKRVFVTRGRDLRRRCRNAHDLEHLFASHGYEVVQPETLDMRSQVDIFAGAEAVAGFGGSAMFNMMHTQGPARWIVIAPTTYIARNEYLIAAARGGDYHHFACEPLPPESSAQPRVRQFHADYEFDFRRDGRALRALLSS